MKYKLIIDKSTDAKIMAFAHTKWLGSVASKPFFVSLHPGAVIAGFFTDYGAFRQSVKCVFFAIYRRLFALKQSGPLW